MSRDHAHRSHSHASEAAPNPKAFAKALADVNEKVDRPFLSIDKDGHSRGDLTIVGFDKCGGLIMKDKNNELFDPRVNLKNGILEITRPLVIPKAAPAESKLEF